MAPISTPKRTTVPFPRLLLIVLIAFMRHQPAKSIGLPVPGTKTLTLFVQDFSSGPNATKIPVAGIAGKLWTSTQFGTIYVGDLIVTETPNLNSTRVGRVQGIFVTTSFDGLSVYVSFSILFTNRAYNGSTLEIAGAVNQFAAVREYAVTGGTGKFRFARGYATTETLFYDRLRSRQVLRANVTVRLN